MQCSRAVHDRVMNMTDMRKTQLNTRQNTFMPRYIGLGARYGFGCMHTGENKYDTIQYNTKTHL